MKGLSKKIVAIVVCALIVGIIAILPGFAETQEQLKSVFVTRKDVGKWVKYAESKMEWAESIANWQIFYECSKEMSLRGVPDRNETALPRPAETKGTFKPYDEGDYVWP